MQFPRVIALLGILAVLSTVAPSAAQLSDFKYPWGPFHVRVVDSWDDRPIPGAALILLWYDPQPADSNAYYDAAVFVTDQDGRAAIPRHEPIPSMARKSNPHTPIELIMDTVAPGYGAVQLRGLSAGENVVSLTARNRMGHDDCDSSAFFVVSIPKKHVSVADLTARVNESRGRMGLEPIDLRTGEPTRLGGKVSCPPEQPENKWGPFTGTVVDKHTEQPIPGAICLAKWLKEVPNPFHPRQEFFDARVAVADKDGRFEIPRRKPPFFSGSVWSPAVVCMAPGYAPQHAGEHSDDPTIPMRLRKLTPDELRMGRSADSVTMLPDDRRLELEMEVNIARGQMGLAPIFSFSRLEGPVQ